MPYLGWDKIVGHDLPIQFLRASLEKDRVGHAYAFVGPSGVGKAATAAVFAQALLCKERTATGDPCGTCRNCGRIERGVHPDVHFVRPEGGSIGIEQVRELQHVLSLKPYESDRKVAVIDEGETMTVAAQNCLLKVLEEPPGDTVIIVVAGNAAALLPTIRSRCQMVRFQPNTVREVVSCLAERGVPREQAALIAALAEGRIGVALEMVGKDVVALRDRVAGWVDELRRDSAGIQAVVRIGQVLEEEKERAGEFLNLFFMWLRDLILIKEGAHEAIANQDAIDRLRNQAAGMNVAAIAGALRAVDRAQSALRSHANLRLTLDVMLVHVQRSLSA